MRFSQTKTYKIISVFLVAVVFFSITGFTLQKHICSYSNKIEYSFFPELLGTKIACCSEKDKVNDAIINHKPLLSKPDCCKNVFLLYRLPSLNTTVVNTIQELNFFFSTFIYNETLLINNTQTNDFSFSLYRPPPLILYGQALIQYIHSFKIPLPELA